MASHAVARQVPEIGLRIPLGAGRRAVLCAVLASGLRSVLLGLALGLGAALAATVAIRSSLFGVQPLDPIALSGVCFVLLATAVVACFVPARRASSVDPVSALRAE